MTATEDETQNLDSGWDDEEPAEDEVDQAWDSVSPPVPVSAAAPSIAPKTEEVDVGWDDAPAPVTGKRRPHRQRRAKSSAVVASANPVLAPRPAEPTKKHQREHARKQRAYEAQVKQQRKQERKAERAAELREENAARLRQTEAEELARKMRKEARERAESERPKPAPRARPEKTAKSSAKKAASLTPEVKRQAASAHSGPPKRSMRVGVIITLLVLAAVVALLVLRK